MAEAQQLSSGEEEQSSRKGAQRRVAHRLTDSEDGESDGREEAQQAEAKNREKSRRRREKQERRSNAVEKLKRRRFGDENEVSSACSNGSEQRDGEVKTRLVSLGWCFAAIAERQRVSVGRHGPVRHRAKRRRRGGGGIFGRHPSCSQAEDEKAGG